MNNEQLTVNRDKGSGIRDQVTGNRDQGTGNREHCSLLRTVGTLVLCSLLIAHCSLPQGNEAAQKTAAFDPDLYGWKTASWIPFSVTDTVTGFAYGKPAGKDRYVAVARGGVIAWSDDGDKWHKAQKAPDEDELFPEPDPFVNVSFNAVAWGNDKFAAVADGGRIAWSADGKSWTAIGYSGGITGFGSENIMGIAFGGNTFVAVGGNANISYSANGLLWSACRDDAFGTSQLNDITFDSESGRFYIVGDDGKRGWSDNPASKNWHFIGPERPFYTNAIRKVTVGRYRNGIGIGIAFNEWDNRRTAIATNADFGGFDDDLDASQFGNNTINGIAWAPWKDGIFIAAGQSAMIGWWPSSEPDKENQRYWRALSFTELQWWEITALAALKDRFYIGAIGGKIGYSK